MIAVELRRLLPRLLLVLLAGIAFYLLEPAFHRHDHDGEAFGLDLGVFGLAATLANFAGLSVLILLAGFISTDRREGYYRLYFSHPTRPLALYGLRWALAVGVAMLATAAFLVLGQFAAWGHFEGGWRGLWLALLAALSWGGLMAFLSAVVRRGDGWVALAVFILTYFWLQAIVAGFQPFTPTVRGLISFLLPPQFAMSDVYDGLLRGEVVWGASAFVAGYGLFWLAAAALALRTRDWP